MEYIAKSLHYLSTELQRLLEIVVLTDQKILDSRERWEELDAFLGLFFELCEETPKSMKKDMENLVHHVQSALPALLGFCQHLDAVQHAAIAQLGEQAVHLIGWAWLRRGILGPKRKHLVADFPPDWQTHAVSLLTTWDEAVRSSSGVENWHSILRPFSARHRHLSASQLALLAVWHNHHIAARGLHKGESHALLRWQSNPPTGWSHWAILLPLQHLSPYHDLSHFADLKETTVSLHKSHPHTIIYFHHILLIIL
jgi:hypothetical protein